MTDKKYATIWVFLGLFAASLEPVAVKIGYRGDLVPLQILAFKNIFAALVMGLFMRGWAWIGWKSCGQVLVVSLLLMTTNFLALYALTSVSAVTLVTIVTTTPAFVGVVNHLLGRDQLGWRFWLGFVLCFAGVLLTVGAGDAAKHHYSSLGLLAAFGAVASSTIYRTRMEVVTRLLKPRVVSSYIFLINGALATSFILPFIEPIAGSEWLICTWIGAAAALANVAFLAAIYLVGSTRMSVFDMLQRPLVIVFAGLILDEALTPEKIFGVALVLLGVSWARSKRLPPAAVQAPESKAQVKGV